MSLNNLSVVLEDADEPVEIPPSPFFNSVGVALETYWDYDLEPEKLIVDVETPAWVDLNEEFEESYGVYTVGDYFDEAVESENGTYLILELKLWSTTEDGLYEGSVTVTVRSEGEEMGQSEFDIKKV